MAPREYNPRYEDDFNAHADYDPDRSRSQARKLQRQLVKEKRGAMRELRRDAAFMATVRLLSMAGACPAWCAARARCVECQLPPAHDSAAPLPP